MTTKPVRFDFTVMLIPNVGDAQTLDGEFSKGLAAKWHGESIAKQMFASEHSPDSIEIVVLQRRELVPEFSRVVTPEFSR